MSVDALHLGPGALGLGLIIPTLHRAGFRVHLLGRPGGVDHLQYSLAWFGTELGSGIVTVAGYSNPASIDDLTDEVLARLGDAAPLLITSALGKAAAERESLLDDMLASRPTGAETVVVACENDPDKAYERLRQRHRGRVIVADAVVDRVCVTPRPSRDALGRRRVIGHPTWEWIIDVSDAGGSELLDRLAAVGVQLTEALDPYEARKLWTVNGLHQVLALITRRKGWDLVADAVETESFQRLSKRLLESFEAIHAACWPDFPHDPGYAVARLDVFAEARWHTTERLLGDYLLRHDLTGLFDRLDQRVFVAARAARRLELDVEPFREVIELLLSVIRRPHMFYDGPAPTEAGDRANVARFARMVDWLDADQQAAETRRFARLLTGI